MSWYRIYDNARLTDGKFHHIEGRGHGFADCGKPLGLFVEDEQASEELKEYRCEKCLAEMATRRMLGSLSKGQAKSVLEKFGRGSVQWLKPLLDKATIKDLEKDLEKEDSTE